MVVYYIQHKIHSQSYRIYYIYTQVLWTSHSWNIHRLVRCLSWLRMTLNKCRSIFGVNPTKGLLESEAMRWPLRNQFGMVFWFFLGLVFVWGEPLFQSNYISIPIHVYFKMGWIVRMTVGVFLVYIIRFDSYNETFFVVASTAWIPMFVAQSKSGEPPFFRIVSG